MSAEVPFEHVEAHHHGDCGLDCVICSLEELDRLTEVHHNETLTNPETYFVAPDQAGRDCLWHLGDDIANPELVVRRDEFRNEEAWGLLVVGVRVAQAVAAPTLVAE